MAKRLLLLNGFAIIGVVLNHSASWGFISMFWWTDRYRGGVVPNFDQIGSISYFILRIIEQVIVFSVPAFLFVSGYFIAFALEHSRATEGWKLAAERIKTLLVPYIIWSLIMFAFSYLQGVRLTFLDYLESLLTGRAAEPYYFIPLLVQLYLLSPLFIGLARKNWKFLLFSAAFFQFVIQGLQYPKILGAEISILDYLLKITPSWFFPTKMLWFVFGIVVSSNLVEFKQSFTRYRKVLLGILVVLLLLGMIEWEVLRLWSNTDWIGYRDTIIDSIYAFTFLMYYISFDKVKVPYSRELSYIGGKSYGVYLVHALVLVLASKAIYHFAPILLGQQGIFQLILITLGLGVPLFLMMIIEKSPVRSLYRFLFG